VTLRAVVLDAGDTLVGVEYAFIAARLQADGHPIGAERVRIAEARARVRLDPHLGARQSTEGAEVFSRYVRFSFAKTSSDSLGTIRNPRARRAGLEIERPGSADRRPCTVPGDSRWMSESGQAALDR
jgi:hypothetical protein